MSEMIYSKVMHLVSPEDFQLIQEKKKEDVIIENNDRAASDEKIKMFNDKYLENQAEKKFMEDRSWNKIGERVKPILQGTLVTSSSNNQASIHSDQESIINMVVEEIHRGKVDKQFD